MTPSKKAKQVDDVPFIENQKMQTALAPITLDYLESFGVSDETALPVEFFFYARDPEHAKALASQLQQRNYELYEAGPSFDNALISVVGCTPRMKMDDETMAHWTAEMCELGFMFDCKFDGWGTIVELNDEV